MAVQVFKDLNELMAYLRHKNTASKLKEVEPKKKKPAKKAKK